ncbi:MAG: TetR/AcrR family transcriptional regulator [Clostridia bacterium]|nr:TetR/AcrR family transcriptional regulator [Clostridia bacterium]
MARRRVNTTKYEIIQQATKLFLEKGYSATTPKDVCDDLNISTGNLTYYFPAKEHLLAVLIEMLCQFQGKALHYMVEEEGTTSLFAVCLELATMASMSEESEIAKDLFISAYSSPVCLDIIRKNDTRRSKQIYGSYCPDWNEQQFIEAEILVSGIEYATLMTTNYSLPLETRIIGAINNIMKIYNVPEEIRRVKIEKVLAIDFRDIGRNVFNKFKEYVDHTNELIFDTLNNN